MQISPDAIDHEEFIGMNTAARIMAVDGKAPHISSVYRRMVDGVKCGEKVVRLHHCRLGRQLVTKRSWIADYIAALSTARVDEVASDSHRRPTLQSKQSSGRKGRAPEQVERDCAAAEKRLAGVGA